MVIHSLSEVCWTRALSSDILYPSNVSEKKRVADQGSISASISAEQSDLFNVTENTSTVFKYTIPLRALSRQVTFYAVGILTAPLGLVYHGLATAGHAALKNRALRNSHGKAFSSDLLMATMTILSAYSMYCLRSYYKNPKCYEKLSPYQLQSRLRLHIYTSIGGLFYTGLGSWDPKISTQILTFSDERAGFYKSLSLKNEFGIVSESGHLLSYDSTTDNEGRLEGRSFYFSGTLYELYASKGVEILLKLKELKDKYPAANIPFPPTATAMAMEINTLRQHEEEHGLIAVAPDRDFLDHWIAEYTKSYKNLNKIQKLVNECVDIKINSLFTSSEDRLRVEVPYPFTQPGMNNFFKGFEGQHGAVKLWSEYQQSIIDALTEAPEDLDNAVVAFEVRLKEKMKT